MITAGSQEALDLVTRVFLDKGDVVIVGAPTYLSALGAFRTVDPDIRQAKLDENGMDSEDLEKVIKQVKAEGKTLKLLYIIPSFQNPTSTMLLMERRKRILELAEKHDFLILEDNPYGYISFEGPMPTPLKGLDKTGRVMYTSTFSKIVSPGMRIGWLVAHREFIAKMVEAKSNISISNALPSQWVAAKLFEKGVVDQQIEKMVKVYRKKRDVMLEAMDASFPKEAKWNHPKGGLFLWVTLPEHVNATEMLMEAVTERRRVHPGKQLLHHEHPQPHAAQLQPPKHPRHNGGHPDTRVAPQREDIDPSSLANI